MAQWVALRHLFEVCVRGEGYERGGGRRKVLWQKEATGKQLWATLEDSLEDKRRRRRSGGEMGM